MKTRYRYLCPLQKYGCIVGRGGETITQLRSVSGAKIGVAAFERSFGSDERVVHIFSSSEKTNLLRDTGELVCPAQDALLMVHERVVADDMRSTPHLQQVTAKLVVRYDQTGAVTGNAIESIRSETGAEVRVLNTEGLPEFSKDSILQISGEPAVVRKALIRVATCLHENPSQFEGLLTRSVNQPSMYPELDFPDHAREFSLRLVCPSQNIGNVIGNGTATLNLIRQESNASIRVDSLGADAHDCVVCISANEYEKDLSPTFTAAMLLQPLCSRESRKKSGEEVITTRLLILRSDFGCLIGRNGSVVSHMRKLSGANIRILTENLPKVASERDAMVLITGSLDAVDIAFTRVASELRDRCFRWFEY